jgi:membrane-associated phospholipid phosphatase
MRLADRDRQWSAWLGTWSELRLFRYLAAVAGVAGSLVAMSVFFLANDLIVQPLLGRATGLPPAGLIVPAFLVTGLIVLGVKWGWRRTRPEETGADVSSLDRYSLPSGHAARAGVLVALLPDPVVWLFAAVVALARVVAKRHYLSDVLAGLAIGIVCGLLASAALAAVGAP